MKKIIYTFPFMLLLCTVFAQQKPTPIYLDQDAPEWAIMLHEENPNIWEIQAAYKTYFAERAFVKNRYTQFYKRWMHWARPYTQADGSLHIPSPQSVLETERLLRQTRNAEETSRDDIWTFQGPKVHYFPDASAQSVDHTNIYSFDIYAADPNILYAGGEAGGLWKTTDKGMNWALLTANILHDAFGAVKINPQNPDVVFAATRGKIIKTTNSGTTWETVYIENNLSVNELYIHSDDPDIVVAASNMGLLRSEDGGINWEKIFIQNTWSVKAKPDDANTIWAIRDNGNSSDFMVSTDAGASFLVSNTGWWQPTGDRQVTGAIIAPCPSNPSKVYAFLSGEGNQLGGYIGVFVSNDAGGSWANTHPGNAIGQPYSIPNHSNLMDANGVDWFHQGFYDQAIVVNPLNDNELIAGGCSWFRSNDGGATWQSYGGYVSSSGITGDRHPDIQWAAAVGNEVWIASDGGLVYSTNFGQSVEGRNYGISGADLWGFGSGWNEDILVGGRYHNGNMAYHESFPEGTYYAIGGAEAPTGYVNPGPERKIYHSDIGGDIIIPGFGNGLGGFPVNTWPNESYAYYANSEMEWHPNCWNIIFLGKEDKIWRSTDGGTTFTVLYDFLGGSDHTVFDIEISRSNPEVMYCSQWDGTDDAIWSSTDGGATWASCTALPLPNNNDRVKLAVSAEDPEVLWASLSYGSNGRKIYKTTNGGNSWTNLTTAVLDGAQITNIMAQYGTDGGVYLGTDRGVFYRNNTMNDWQPYSDGLPLSAKTNRLKPFYKTGLIRNGCWGFGVWEAPLFEPSAVQALAMADKLESFCPTDTFYFDDYSVVLHEGASWSWQFPDAETIIGADTRTPKVVFGTAGLKTAIMTLNTPQGVFTDTLTVMVGDECHSLIPEAYPGYALSFDGDDDYAIASENLDLNTNTATFTAWIKPIGNQSDWAGIILCRGGNTTAGLHFGENNELHYMWNDQNWWWNSGLFPPLGEWSHVAMVIEPTQATLYLNGIPAVFSTTHQIEEFDTPLVLGSDSGWNNRYFNGLMDEVSIYNKALSQNQIREEMHLTRTHTDTDALLSYYQFNETEGLAFDRVGLGFISFGGDAVRETSTVAVGPGVSSRLDVVSPGPISFGETGVNINFPENGTLPNGEMVVTRLDIDPDQYPSPDTVSTSYWVLHNFGQNPVFDMPVSLEFTQVGNIPVGTTPLDYQLLSRPPRADGNTWQVSDYADSFTTGTNGSLTFSVDNGVQEAAQLAITKPLLVGTTRPDKPKLQVNISPNPVASNGVLRVKTNLNGTVRLRLFDGKGRAIRLVKFEGTTDLALNDLEAGIYFYAVENEAFLGYGKVVVY
ncbi:MAG: hypothetical protein DHS20C18_10700 [Saprospiraceae bacterium]|nr:MAG: hypothetical protein DHS20C18_10700 [Saprospiraceae bacterium]